MRKTEQFLVTDLGVMERNFRKGFLSHLHRQKDSILSKCQFFPILSIVQRNSNENLSQLFCGYQQTHSTVYSRGKRPRRASTTLTEKNKAEELTPHMKSYDKTIVIKIVWYWRQNKLMEQNAEPRNRCTQINLLFDKRAKAI